MFILGDLFEVWVGDDMAHEPGFEAPTAPRCCRPPPRRAAVFFMHGNRDFLVGDGFLRRLRHDAAAPIRRCWRFAGKRWLLTHGDALCLADTDYMRFRAQVRNPAWQREFLCPAAGAAPGASRSGMREQSEARKRIGASNRPTSTALPRQAWLRRPTRRC